MVPESEPSVLLKYCKCETYIPHILLGLAVERDDLVVGIELRSVFVNLDLAKDNNLVTKSNLILGGKLLTTEPETTVNLKLILLATIVGEPVLGVSELKVHVVNLGDDTLCIDLTLNGLTREEQVNEFGDVVRILGSTAS